MKTRDAPPEKGGAKAEANESPKPEITSPMEKFRRLAATVTKVSREEVLREESRQKRRNQRKKDR